ncbi:MAG: T9SS type A sorting domain-containing protein [Bacteroidia bacterium]|nr:T9SS type A sorting domain-containing protein [Bacteroidia bacterium]HQU99846.1 T9SS type A sorting domain-containing protein [Bacteroidia bacterium]
MINKKLAMLLTSMLTYTGSMAQSVFQKTYTQGINTEFTQIINTSDGGFANIGSFNNSNDDICLVKTDAIGNVQFTTTLTSPTLENAKGVIQTNSGDYIICGNITINNTNAIYLAAINASGSLLWQKYYDAGKTDVANSIKLAANGDFIIAGYTTSVGIAYPKGLLMRTDAAGNLLWSKAYTQIHTQTFNKVIEASDGSLIAVGSQVAFGNTDYDWVVLHTDSAGTLIWNYTYGDLSDEEAYDIIQVGGYYYVTGYTASAGAGSRDMFVMQLGLAGNILGGTVIGTEKSETAFNIHYYDNTSLAITGVSEITSAAGNKEVGTILRTDFLLNPYQATYLGDSNAVFNPISSVVNATGKIALSGKYKAPGNTNFEGLLMQNNLAYSAACNELYPTILTSNYIPNHNAQTTELLVTFATQAANLVANNPTITLNTLCFSTGLENKNKHLVGYPNPATDFINLDAIWHGSSIQISNLQGKLSIEATLSNDYKIDVKSLQPGLYIATINKYQEQFRFKFVKQ